MDFLCGKCYRKDMSSMQFTFPRATLDEVLLFANAVRKAGGGNPLDALMPAVPGNSTQCLIAKNLNFNCDVRCLVDTEYRGRWAMHFDDKALCERISTALDLPMVTTRLSRWDERHPDSCYAMVLPREIGQVATDFDEWSTCLIYGDRDPSGQVRYVVMADVDDAALDRLREFTPYVVASIRETEAHGLLDENGRLIL